jgi:hypothetical protein
VEIQGQGTTLLKSGEAGIIAAELVHLARNESAASAKALVVHSRAAKDKPLMVVVKT